MNKDHDNLTMEMAPATFPLVTMEMNGTEYNQLHGCSERMDVAFQRDTVTVLGESRETGESGETGKTGESRETGEKISRLVIVAHGGTQMAVMNRFNCDHFSGKESRESRTDDYYSWQLPCGQGYVLEAQTDAYKCKDRS